MSPFSFGLTIVQVLLHRNLPQRSPDRIVPGILLQYGSSELLLCVRSDLRLGRWRQGRMLRFGEQLPGDSLQLGRLQPRRGCWGWTVLRFFLIVMVPTATDDDSLSKPERKLQLRGDDELWERRADSTRDRSDCFDVVCPNNDIIL